MAGKEYVPLELPGDAITFVAAGPITAGQLVTLTAPWAVSATSVPTAALCGVAAQTVAPGQGLTVYLNGVHALAANGPIAAGDPVIAGAIGGVSDLGTGTNYAQIVGYALSGSTGSMPVAVRLGR